MPRPKGKVLWRRISITIPDSTLQRIDAARNEQTRSAWLVQAAQDALGPVAVDGASGPMHSGQAILPGVMSDAEALAAYSARVGGRLAE